MEEDRPRRSYVTSVIRCYCPRCREGKLFKYKISVNLRKNMEMNPTCPECGQATEIEVGFYYGTGYVSYLVAFFLSIATFLLWWLIIGFSLSDNRFFYWIFFNAFFLLAMQPYLMRFARSLWISFFVRYDPDWEHTKPEEPERINETQMNNW
jgi:uncharacterized protein (DUF983 family)